MLFCEICEIFKNTSFYRTNLVAASRNMSSTLSLLHLRMMTKHVLAILRLFHFIACVSVFSISFLFFVDCTTFWFRGKFCQYLNYCQLIIGVVLRFLSRVSKGEMDQPDLAINVTGLVQFGKI